MVREAKPNANDAIRLTNIRKVYTSRNLTSCSTTTKVAVKNLNFGVRKGECFGFLGECGGRPNPARTCAGTLAKLWLLSMVLALPPFDRAGINGAGKTSTLQILSGDSVPTSGGAKLLGLDIMTQQLQVRRLLGYCPQFDALFGE